MAKYLGIDIGGTKTSLIIGTETYEILDKVKFKTDSREGFESFRKRIYEHSLKMGTGGIERIGVSVGGPLNHETGEIYNPTYLPWGTVNLKKEFGRLFNVPIEVEHDARAGAYAEYLLGAGRGCDNIIFLTLGTGIGAGIIIGGKKYYGFNGITGEIGHIRVAEDGPYLYGKKGSIEGLCSGGGISLLAMQMFPQYFEKDTTCKDIGELSGKGDKKANEVLKRSGFYFGRALSILFDLFSPDRIILGGLGYRLPGIWLSETFKELKNEAVQNDDLEKRVVSSHLKEKIGDYAALVTAIG